LKYKDLTIHLKIHKMLHRLQALLKEPVTMVRCYILWWCEPESFNVLSVGSSPAPVTPPQDGACLNRTTSNKLEKVLTVIDTINYNLVELNKII